jgi:hypothetical protein
VALDLGPISATPPPQKKKHGAVLGHRGKAAGLDLSQKPPETPKPKPRSDLKQKIEMAGSWPKLKRKTRNELAGGDFLADGFFHSYPGRVLVFNARVLETSTQPPTRACDPNNRSKNAALGVFMTPGVCVFCPLRARSSCRLGAFLANWGPAPLAIWGLGFL